MVKAKFTNNIRRQENLSSSSEEIPAWMYIPAWMLNSRKVKRRNNCQNIVSDVTIVYIIKAMQYANYKIFYIHCPISIFLKSTYNSHYYLSGNGTRIVQNRAYLTT